MGIVLVGGVGIFLFALFGARRRRRRRRAEPGPLPEPGQLAADDLVIFGNREWTAGELRAFLRAEFGSATDDEIENYIADFTMEELDEFMTMLRDLGLRRDRLYLVIANYIATERAPLLDPYADEEEEEGEEPEPAGEFEGVQTVEADEELEEEPGLFVERLNQAEPDAGLLREEQVEEEDEGFEAVEELDDSGLMAADPGPGEELVDEEVDVMPDGFDPELAFILAPRVNSALRRAPYMASTRRLVADFQLAAWGDSRIEEVYRGQGEGPLVDGLYGRLTKGALRHFGVSRPPTALYGPRTEVPYQEPPPVA